MVAGNSLGGYASLATAVKYPEAVKGVVLLNAAGRFEEVKAEAQAQVEAALPDNPVGQEAKGALREVGTSQSSATQVPGCQHLWILECRCLPISNHGAWRACIQSQLY